MRVIIKTDATQVAQWTAHYIADKINAQKDSKNPSVLGLPTGSTPLQTYAELIALHKAGEVSFANVVTFNMDEYVGLPREHPQSYHSFMWENFFSHVDIKPENVNILNGNAANLKKECWEYEQKISAYVGIQLFLCGIGADGHLAFNEPFSSLQSRTRIKTLTSDTIAANARFFDNDIAKVPRQALTMGVGTVMDAREIVMLATGYNKARALQQTIEGAYSHACTASVLQTHPRSIIVCDDAATSELKVGTYRYFKEVESSL
jgi:glucosamine-6-phosphate deaminase